MIKKIAGVYVSLVSKLKDLPPLAFRLVLAYGFYGPAIKKFNHFDNIIEWFDKGLGLPFPELNAYLATGTEMAGVALLTLGLATRFISVPLMVTMVVAITTVHWSNGFAASKNGFEIPFYYLLMLFSLVVTGAGKFSLDHLIAKKCSDTCGTESNT
ncbi:MAG: DoxX family protein [Bdellovibrionales bacterium]|nr:DoxX family protein [Bdellovibrionales bacterium]